MPVPADFKTMKAKVRSITKAALGLPDGTPIPEAGSDPILIQPSRIPMAMLRWHPVMPCGVGGQPERGVAVRNAWGAPICDIWIYFNKTAGVDDTDTAWDLIGPIWSAIWADRRLGGDGTEMHIEQINLTGESPDNPFANVVGEGTKAAALTVSFILVEDTP